MTYYNLNYTFTLMFVPFLYMPSLLSSIWGGGGNNFGHTDSFSKVWLSYDIKLVYNLVIEL